MIWERREVASARSSAVSVSARRPVRLLAVLMVCVASLVASPSLAQDSPEPAPEEVGADAEADAAADEQGADGEGAADGETDEGGASGAAVDEDEAAAAAAEVARAEAQADVAQARKLARIQRYDEAVKLLQEAYLVLEDPEVLRMLGEIHEDMGQKEVALRYYDDYLDDPAVGEMSRAPVEEKREALREALGVNQKSHGDGDGGPDDPGSRWQSSGAKLGRPGRLYLRFGARAAQTVGADFSREAGGDDLEVADDIVNDEWRHGGVGGEVEVGRYFTERLSLGAALGLDAMRWEALRAQDAFATQNLRGLRPDLHVNFRYFAGWGFNIGASAGGDLMILTQGQTNACSPDVDCPGLDSGVLGARLAVGILAGYRAEINDDWSIGIDTAWRLLPVVALREASGAADLPNYGDSAWYFAMALGLNWNL